MQHQRFKPGSLLSRDGATLFVFGGCDQNSVESINLNDDKAEWQLVFGLLDD